MMKKIDQKSLLLCEVKNDEDPKGSVAIQLLILKKCIAFVFLLCFAFPSVVEAKRSSSSPSVTRKQSRVSPVRTRQPQTTALRTKQFGTPQTRARPIRTRQTRAKPLGSPQTRARSFATRQAAARAQQVAARAQQAAAQQAAVRAQQAAAQQAAARAQQVEARAQQVAAQQAAVQKPAVLPKPQVTTYLSLLKPHTQKNAQLGGLDTLYPKHLEGQGQMVAVIESSGTWKGLRDAINNPQSKLTKEIRENYKNSFLPSIGKLGGLNPEEQNEFTRIKDPDFHGSKVSSVILDLSPKAKILPVSTYGSFQRGQDVYDVADALMDLLEREKNGVIQKVGVINISAGYINSTIALRDERDENGILLRYTSKTVYTPRLVEAFKAVAQAGKVIVIGAGNAGEDIQPPQFTHSIQDSKEGWGERIGHIVETLDPIARESVIIAGNIDPNTRAICKFSNKPGNWLEAQDRFLYAPGHHMPSYMEHYTGKGTSFSSPYICAAIANLCSKPGVTPKRAVKALLETADERPEKAIYGRGLIRADKALEWLERGN